MLPVLNCTSKQTKPVSQAQRVTFFWLSPKVANQGDYLANVEKGSTLTHTFMCKCGWGGRRGGVPREECETREECDQSQCAIPGRGEGKWKPANFISAPFVVFLLCSFWEVRSFWRAVVVFLFEMLCSLPLLLKIYFNGSVSKN